MNVITKLSNRYKKAKTNLEIVENLLNQEVSEIVKKNPSVDDIYDLIAKLPQTYIGVRRLFELIERSKKYTVGPLKR